MPAYAATEGVPRRAAWRFVLAVGMVSLFADMAYEGARGINGPFLGHLGASGAVVGAVAGGGELLAYGLRIVSGRFVDRRGAYWPVAVVGYALNMAAVPLLALAGSWWLAAGFMLLERTGKAIRNPPRDAMLAQASHHIGHGRTFGTHEAMDRFGAVVGPLLAAVVLARRGDYQAAYALLGIPAAAALAVLVLARTMHRRLGDPARASSPAPRTPLVGRPLRLTLMAGGLLAAGMVDFPLLAYHVAGAGTFGPAAVPVLYAAANAVAGLWSYGLGHLVDRIGPRRLAVASLLPAGAALAVVTGGAPGAVVGMVLWGTGLACVAGLYKPILAAITPPDRRATGFGTFDAVFGVSWFAGSLALGVVYDHSPFVMAVASAGLVVASVPFLARAAPTAR